MNDTTLPKVLLVEDDEYHIERITEALEFAGYEVVHVDSTVGAMRAIDQRVEGSQIFDCIVLDYFLHDSKSWPNGENGTFVLKQFKNALRRGGPKDFGLEKFPPVIAHSSDDDNCEEMIALGATAAIAKRSSISLDPLIAKIDELVTQ